MRPVLAIFVALALLCGGALALPPNGVPIGFFKPKTAAGPAVVTNTDHGTTSGGTYSFGTASADRIIVVALSTAQAAGATVVSVTVGGVSAAKRVSASLGGSSSGDWAELWTAAVPTGATGTISIGVSSGLTSLALSVYSLTGISNAVPTNTITASGGSLTIPSNGVAIGVITNVQSGAVSFTWAGLTKNTDFSGSNAVMQSSAASLGPVAGTTITVSATPSASIASKMVAASWSP